MVGRFTAIGQLGGLELACCVGLVLVVATVLIVIVTRGPQQVEIKISLKVIGLQIHLKPVDSKAPVDEPAKNVNDKGTTSR
jgi:uncharacterized membrane protein (UPF0136 family)